jgi:hypothetical protein
MNKRSAITLAGGVTGALVSGVVGYSVRVGTPPAAAGAVVSPVKPSVQVKTITTTVRIHKKAKVHHVRAPASGYAPTQVVTYTPPHSAPPPVTHTSGSPSGGGDDSHEGGDD